MFMIFIINIQLIKYYNIYYTVQLIKLIFIYLLLKKIIIIIKKKRFI